MEKLTVVYNDGSSLKVSNKRDGLVKGYYERNVQGASSIKSAVIQKYPKKTHKPIVLVG